jgi:hypothetical protein
MELWFEYNEIYDALMIYMDDYTIMYKESPSDVLQ